MKKAEFIIAVNEHYEFNITEEALRNADIVTFGKESYHMIIDGESFEFFIKSVDLESKKVNIQSRGKMFSVVIKDSLDQLIDTLGLELESVATDSNTHAPMPGLVLEVLVEQGQLVEEGDQLLILEAMKMENVIKAPGKGVIEEIMIKKGDSVEKGQVLMSFTKEED
ncbi:MAG: biotin/lipoyl-binding protein [Saprospirales bacterium]|nr:MAG: biotin/lipoyl-binding protein [Saprospirales bacterium]